MSGERLSNTTPLSPKAMDWLKLAAADSYGYPGIQWEMAPKAFRQLQSMGLVESWLPDNPVHKRRAVATQQGREMVGRT
jgi:hypothetical protein